jgi:3-phenylpropionate/trans-cinnamate dioxygenase ferredoxin subunit
MPEFVTVATLAQVPEGRSLLVKVKGKEISLWNAGGTIYAIDDTCTHEEASLTEGELVDDFCVMCPLHGSEFDLRTGKPRSLPATESVGTYLVQIAGDEIQVAV